MRSGIFYGHSIPRNAHKLPILHNRFDEQVHVIISQSDCTSKRRAFRRFGHVSGFVQTILCECNGCNLAAEQAPICKRIHYILQRVNNYFAKTHSHTNTNTTYPPRLENRSARNESWLRFLHVCGPGRKLDATATMCAVTAARNSGPCRVLLQICSARNSSEATESTCAKPCTADKRVCV